MHIDIHERLKAVWVDKAIQYHPVTLRILNDLDSIPVSHLNVANLNARIQKLSLTEGKRILLLTQFTGPMVKPCPGTSEPYLCCQYTVINQGNQCPMDCTYCVLQNYLETPVIVQYVNIESAFSEIRDLLAQNPHRFYRFGTGELADSLALDPLTRLSVEWLSFFGKTKNALIELKTKSTHVDSVLSRVPKNTVISWSLNPQPVIQTEELFAPDLEARLKAARRCQDAGFLLAFHFDPVIYLHDWERLYGETIEKLFQYIDWQRIVWISLGALRYPPNLHRIMQKRFPGSRLSCQEMIRGLDGKLRYPRPLRVALFQSIYQQLKAHGPELFIYFCMEPPWVWEQVTGTTPASNAELDFWFACSVFSRFKEVAMEEPGLACYQ